MSDLDSLLNPGEDLYVVSRYQLGREDGRILIDCFEPIAGVDEPKEFCAVPYLTWSCAKTEFYGYGDTKEDALKDCLAKIKDQKYEYIVGIGDENV